MVLHLVPSALWMEPLWAPWVVLSWRQNVFHPAAFGTAIGGLGEGLVSLGPHANAAALLF